MKIKATILSILYPRQAVLSCESTIPNSASRIPNSPMWYVLSTTAGKVVGSTRLTLRALHAYIFDGDYSVYQGQQNFKFKSVYQDIPVDSKALLDYAVSCTKGLGPSFAASVWKKYGDKWTIALTETKSPKEKALLKTFLVLKQDSARTDAKAYLINLGCTEHLAEQAVAAFGDATLSYFRENPYILAELPGQSFATIDSRLREPLKIDHNDPLRIRSLCNYLINTSAETTGDTLVDFYRIKDEACNFGIDTDLIYQAITGGDFYCFNNPEAISTAKLVEQEDIIFNYLTHANPNKIVFLDSIDNHTDIKLDASQSAAVLNAVSHFGVSIINGGAGCGKTTIIKRIADIFEENGIAFRICAFAGKAAARVREATGHDASTIHSMLEYNPVVGFQLGTIEGISVIIDEASMVPAYLLAAICKRNPDRLILVGDEAQLPPVGAGSPFHDIVQHFSQIPHSEFRIPNSPLSTVTTCYRNAEAIFQAAHEVRNGGIPMDGRSAHESCTIMRVRNATEAQAYVEGILQHLDFSTDIIIAPRNGDNEDSTATVASLNAAAMKHLRQANVIEPGARILCTKNDPQLNVWNGTTAVVDAVDTDGKAYVTTDDGTETQLPTAYTKKHVAPAYALTIHKAQGSQYRRVVILCLNRDMATLLDRAMLYTAITRAKEGVVIVTDTDLYRCSAKATPRSTILKLRLQSL